jgi:NADPH:quinone reductase-like Zn-dependent oxidoreductase
MCAGITTFNGLRNSGARPGDVVAVLGLGGLGHLGVQYAAKMGFHDVAIARGKDKEALARQMGSNRNPEELPEVLASSLIQTAQAAMLLGAQVVMVGIRPEIAQSIIGLGIDLRHLKMYSDLASAISMLQLRRALQ